VFWTKISGCAFDEAELCIDVGSNVVSTPELQGGFSVACSTKNPGDFLS
jgi:hypothetical protein